MGVATFGPFRFDPEDFRLKRDGTPVLISPKALEILRILLETPGVVVRREVLLTRLWPGVHIEPGALPRHISDLRRALGDSPGEAEYIETVPKVGYRFAREVTVEISTVDSDAPIPAPPVDRWPIVLAISALILSLLLVPVLLRPKAVRAVPAFAVRPPEDSSAWHSYLAGRRHWDKRTKQGFLEAVRFFQQAIDANPVFALAHSALGDTYVLIGGYGVVPQPDVIEKARSAAKRALQLDPSLGEPHATLGLIAQNYDLDWSAAEREHRESIRLNPRYATARHWYGEFLTLMTRFEEGIVQLRIAHEIDPMSPAISTDLAKALYLARRSHESMAQSRRVLLMHPDFANAYEILGLAEAVEGHHAEAIGALTRAAELDGSTPYRRLMLMIGYASAGDRVAVERIRSELARDREVQLNFLLVAGVEAILGNNNAAMASLERGYQQRAIGLSALLTSPVFDTLRGDARFAALLRRLSLVPVSVSPKARIANLTPVGTEQPHRFK